MASQSRRAAIDNDFSCEEATPFIAYLTYGAGLYKFSTRMQSFRHYVVIEWVLLLFKFGDNGTATR